MSSVDQTLGLLRDAALAVMGELGAGHSEAVYHAAVLAELSSRGVLCRSEVCCPFMYRAACVGYGKADIVVGNVVVELKIHAAGLAESRVQLLRYVESIASLEKREFVGALLVMSRACGKVLLQGVDADGDSIFEYPAPSTAEAPDDGDGPMLKAFLGRYKFSCTSKAGVPLQRLQDHLRKTTGGAERDVDRFIAKHFSCRTETHAARRFGSRRRVVCYPLSGGGVILA